MKCFTEEELLALLRQAYSFGHFAGVKRPNFMPIAQREKELAELIRGGKGGRSDAGGYDGKGGGQNGSKTAKTRASAGLEGGAKKGNGGRADA